MQDRPTAEELVAQLGSLLGELADTVPREQRFRTLVAANACAMLARELAGADAQRAAERDRLSVLLGRAADDAWDARTRLAAAIRRGRFDERIPATVVVLRESVAAKLAVAHPEWTGFSDDGRG